MVAASRIKQWTKRLFSRQPPQTAPRFGSTEAEAGPTSGAAPDGLLFDPGWPELAEDPYPAFHNLRSQEPVYWCPPMNSWLVTRYADAVTVLRDERFSSDREVWPERPLKAVEDCLGAFGRVRTMINSDLPLHGRLRGPTVTRFSSPAVETGRPRVQAVVDELLDAVEPAGRMDIANDLAIPLAVTGATDILGVPPEDREAAFRWSEAFGAVLDFLDPNEGPYADRSSAEMTAFFHPQIEARRKHRAEDVLSDLISETSEGEELSEDEVLATCTLLLSAVRNSAYVIGNGLFALLQAPEQLQKLRDDPSLTNSAIEEMMRFDGPAFGVVRLATQDIELGGKRIRRNQAVQVLLQAADRDPEQFADPDELQISRHPNHHLAFGYGTHVCLGRWLARVQAQVAVTSLLSRYPNLRLGSDRPQWVGALLERRLKTLPVLL